MTLSPFQVEAVLPLTALVLPLMWRTLDIYGVAKILIVFNRFKNCQPEVRIDPSISSNGVRQELKMQTALQHELGLFPVQWQCRFRILASKVGFLLFCLFMFYLYLIVNELCRKWVEFQSINQSIDHCHFK